MTKDEIVMRIYANIPDSAHIKDLDTSRECSIQFTWFGSIFRVSDNLHVDVVHGNLLMHNNEACLLQKLLSIGPKQ